MQWMEVIKSAFSPYMDDEKPPLHLGEGFNLWVYLIGVEQSKRAAEVGHNTAQDLELKARLKDLMDNIHTPIINEMTEFLKQEVISLPQATAEKPLFAERKEIPVGLSMTDEEIANMVIFNEIMGTQIAGKSLTESLRADVGAMFMKYFLMKNMWLLTMRSLMKERGWLKTPPYLTGN